VGLAKTWALKTQGEYRCPKCGGISNIVLDRLLYLFAFLAILVSAIFFAVGFIGLLSLDIWLLLLVLLPFLLFYLISVFLVRLKKPAVRKRRAPPPYPPVRGAHYTPESTRYRRN
jgi:membrane protein implicated in regulation of membrane protease activity